jgi:hypothetical protein
MYAETDAKIMRELHCDIVMTVLRDVQRIRPEAFEKMLSETRAEQPSGGGNVELIPGMSNQLLLLTELKLRRLRNFIAEQLLRLASLCTRLAKVLLAWD